MAAALVSQVTDARVQAEVIMDEAAAERQRMDAESKLMQAQDAAAAVKSDLEQQKSRVADLQTQIESMKKADGDLKSQQDAKHNFLTLPFLQLFC